MRENLFKYKLTYLIITSLFFLKLNAQSNTWVVNAPCQGIFKVYNPFKNGSLNKVAFFNEKVAYYSQSINDTLWFYAPETGIYYLNQQLIDIKLPTKSPSLLLNKKNKYIWKLENTLSTNHWFTDICTKSNPSIFKVSNNYIIKGNINLSFNLHSFDSNTKFTISINGEKRDLKFYKQGDNNFKLNYTGEISTIKIEPLHSLKKIGIYSLKLTTHSELININNKFSITTDLKKLQPNITYFQFEQNTLTPIKDFEKISFSSPVYFQQTKNIPLLKTNFVEYPDTSKCDYLIISADDFINEAILLEDDLKKLHHNFTFKVQVTSKIYNFNHSSIANPLIIKQYISKVNPKYVLLIGDYAQKNFTPLTQIPTYIYRQKKFNVAIETDYWFSYNDNPYSPVRAVGRIPINSKDELTTYINKLKLYLNNQNNYNPSLLYDDYGIISKLPKSKHSIIHKKGKANERNFLSKTFGFVFGTKKMTKIINRKKPTSVVYVGHASIKGWSNNKKIRLHHLKSLKPNCIYTQIDFCCNTGRFAFPKSEGIMEKAIRLPNRGPITAITPTGYLLLQSIPHYAKAFYHQNHKKSIGFILNDLKEELLNNNTMTIDEAFALNILGIPSLKAY